MTFSERFRIVFLKRTTKGEAMEESIILEKLSGFGLTRQEASLYLYLLQTTGATGYEAAK